MFFSLQLELYFELKKKNLGVTSSVLICLPQEDQPSSKFLQ